MSQSRFVSSIDRTLGLVSILILLVFPSVAVGKDYFQNFQVHGFLTQTARYTSANAYFSDSEDRIARGTTEAGLNGTVNVTPRIRLASQGIYRKTGDLEEGELNLDYALFDLSLWTSGRIDLGLRGGRVKNPLGFYNETRDVARTRPSIVMPQSIYIERIRDFLLASDGAFAYLNTFTPHGDINLEAGITKFRPDEQIEVSSLGRDFPGDYVSDVSFVSRVLFDGYNGVRLGFSNVLTELDYDSTGAPDDLREATFTTQLYIASAQYNRARWSVTGEYFINPFTVRSTGSDGLQRPTNQSASDGFYLQSTYRWMRQLKSYVRYERIFRDRQDRDGEAFQEATGLPAHNAFARDITLGVRWSPIRSVLVMLEYHNVAGTVYLPFTLNDPAQTKKHWDLVELLISYDF